MRATIFRSGAFFLAVATTLGACGGGSTCGEGTVEQRNTCVPLISCGAGTEAHDGVCVPACTSDEVWNGDACVPRPDCAPGTVLDGTSCVPACDAGEHWDGSACVAGAACAAGTRLDPETGQCQPEVTVCGPGTHLEGAACVADATSCGEGTHLEGGVCVRDDLPAADVDESPEPAGVASFDLPVAGEVVTLGGVVDTPTDLDGDGYDDPDYDEFQFDAAAGTWLRLEAMSAGTALPALVILSVERDASGAPRYLRYCLDPNSAGCSREVYLPRAGRYRILVSDDTHVSGDLFGWGYFPVGGAAFGYQVAVSNLGVPTPTDLGALPQEQTGDLTDGGLRFYRLTGVQVDDAIQIRTAGTPAADGGSDVFGALQVLDPAGGLVRDVAAYQSGAAAGALFAALAPGDYLVVQDYLLAIGTRRAFTLSAAAFPVRDCDVVDCATGALAANETLLLRWAVPEGDLFVGGVYLPADATATMRARFLDRGLTPLGDTQYVSATGNAHGERYAAAATKIHALLWATTGTAIPAWTTDVARLATPLLPSGTPVTGITVLATPPQTFTPQGLAHVVGAAGQVVITRGFAPGTGPWTAPREVFSTADLAVVGPAYDLGVATFLDAPLAPLMAWFPTAGHLVHRVLDDGVDLTGATYDVTAHLETPQDLGTLGAGGLSVSGATLGAQSGVAVFRYQAGAAQATTLTVTRAGGATIVPEVFVLEPGRAVYPASASQYEWQADPSSPQLGARAHVTGLADGTPATVAYTPSAAGPVLVLVRDAAGLLSADTFDLTLSE